MRTSLSASRWICLLTLAVVMLFSASEGRMLGMSCCDRGQSRQIHDIQRCFEQKPRNGCIHAFVIITSNNQKICVKSTSQWLRKHINRGELNCPPEFSIKGRFEVLDEDDFE